MTWLTRLEEDDIENAYLSWPIRTGSMALAEMLKDAFPTGPSEPYSTSRRACLTFNVSLQNLQSLFNNGLNPAQDVQGALTSIWVIISKTKI